MTADLVVGIDPGVLTGLAVWDKFRRELRVVASMGAMAAMAQVSGLNRDGCLRGVVFEDARLRTWFGIKGREAWQGAGSIKRDCSLWEEFLRLHSIEFKAVSPRQKGSKLDAAAFERLTGWPHRTNEHSRDAGLLVFGL